MSLLKDYAEEEGISYAQAGELLASEVQDELIKPGTRNQPRVRFERTWRGLGPGRLVAINL
jgi:hypothetical protein